VPCEIFHGLYALNKIQLRHLLDLALIRARHEGAIDWNELDRRFSTSGLGEVLATYLYFSDELLGQPAPKLRHTPRKDAMAELRSVESRDSFQFKIESLKTTCDNLQTALSLMTADRDRLQTELDNVMRARANMERELAHILTSRSWRLTEPLRTIIAALRRWLR